MARNAASPLLTTVLPMMAVAGATLPALMVASRLRWYVAVFIAVLGG